ncbi:MAG: hypothetical protein ACYDG6_06870 [Thermincolia bacterium]
MNQKTTEEIDECIRAQKELCERSGAPHFAPSSEITIPLLNESDKTFTIPVELELNKPKSEDQKPSFALKCSKIKQYLKEAT